MKHVLLATLFVISPVPGLAASQLQGFTASYSTTINSIPVAGTAERKLTRQSDHILELTFNAGLPFYHFSEQSRFTLDANNRIQPISYQLADSDNKCDSCGC